MQRNVLVTGEKTWIGKHVDFSLISLQIYNNVNRKPGSDMFVKACKLI